MTIDNLVIVILTLPWVVLAVRSVLEERRIRRERQARWIAEWFGGRG